MAESQPVEVQGVHSIWAAVRDCPVEKRAGFMAHCRAALTNVAAGNVFTPMSIEDVRRYLDHVEKEFPAGRCE